MVDTRLKFRENDPLRISSNGRSKLQRFSDRRAIINFVIDSGGETTLAEIEEQFGVPMRSQVTALVRLGWLRVVGESCE